MEDSFLKNQLETLLVRIKTNDDSVDQETLKTLLTFLGIQQLSNFKQGSYSLGDLKKVVS